jgi:hypothetical protein
MLIAVLTLGPLSVAAQEMDTGNRLPQLLLQEDEEPSIEVLVLGSFHFKHAPEFNPIQAPEQQKEIKDLVNRLSDFKPDKIAVEYVRKDSLKVDSLYRSYRKGNYELAVNEREQIGFRLAKQLDHPKVHAIDYLQPWGMNKTMKWAQKNNPEFTDYVEQWQKENTRMDSIMHQKHTIGEILSVYASEAFIDRVQKIRMKTLEVGADKNYTGVDPVASVYERNMRIFANLTSVAEPGDRVLIVYGAGHSYFFNEFISQHPDMKLVDPSEYLPNLN